MSQSFEPLNVRRVLNRRRRALELSLGRCRFPAARLGDCDIYLYFMDACNRLDLRLCSFNTGERDGDRCQELSTRKWPRHFSPRVGRDAIRATAPVDWTDGLEPTMASSDVVDGEWGFWPNLIGC